MLRTYSMEEIRQSLNKQSFPLSGTTPLGTTEFHFREPARYLGVALHAGGRVREDLAGTMAVSPGDRFREEDPFTGVIIEDFPLRLVARDSRFEYDLNWEEEKCIYEHSKKKWGLQVWNRELEERERALSLEKFREFHTILDLVVNYVLDQGWPAILFDVHSFCYQRDGDVIWYRDGTPEINLGTRYINREHFSGLIERFLQGVSGNFIDGYPVEVGENRLFPGGYLTRKYAAMYNMQLLVLAIEYKKIFMDERTGKIHWEKLSVLKENLMEVKDQLLDMI